MTCFIYTSIIHTEDNKLSFKTAIMVSSTLSLVSILGSIQTPLVLVIPPSHPRLARR